MNTKKVAAVLLVVFLLAGLAGCNSSAYKKAEALLNEGRYEEAATAFFELGDYMDSVEKADYARAGALFENREYEAAAAVFEALGGFMDASERAAEAALEHDYQTANHLFSAGNYAEALAIYETLLNLYDSAEQAELCNQFIIYNGAVAAMNSFGTSVLHRKRLLIQACNGFNAVRGFEDADEKLAESLSLLLPELFTFSEYANSDIDVRGEFSDLLLEGAELVKLLFSDQTLNINEDVRIRAGELPDAIALWITYCDIKDAHTRNGISVLSGLWRLLQSNNAPESIDILTAFFAGFTPQESSRIGSMQTFLGHLDDGFIIEENFYSESWRSFLTQHRASLYELFLSATIFQTLYPGSGAGQGYTGHRTLTDDFYDIIGTAANGGLLVIRNNNISADFLFSCDPRIVPRSLEEVEYIVEVTYGTRNAFRYNTGTQGIREYAQVRLLRYPGGRVVRNFGEVLGSNPPDSFTYTGNPPATRSGGSPNAAEIDTLIERAIEYVIN